MAALGKIRSKGAILIGIIGLGLFAFIAEEGVKSCEYLHNDKRQQVGEVLGENIGITEFQKMVDEYTEVVRQGQENLSEEQLTRVRDVVWNTYVQNKLIANEAAKLGLTVTDQELTNIFNEGTNPMLLQTPFVNRQTGRFDANSLKQFLASYKAQPNANPQMAAAYKYWTFTERTLRQQLLAQKYQSLLAHCFISNKVEAKMAYNDQNQESKIQLAAMPYSSISDSKVTYTDADLKAKYDEMKPRFRQFVESRDIKYVDIQVKASAKDVAALQKQFAGYAKELATTANPAEVVSNSSSLVSYLGIPVSKDAYPYDIAARLDSMAVGSTSAVINGQTDNTLNVIKLVSKQQLPDSVQFRRIDIMGANDAATKKTADSVYTALRGGADFEAIAKKYGQDGQKNWITTAQYQSAPSLDNDTKNFIESLNTMSANEIKKIDFAQGSVVIQVLDRRHMINKYVAAVIKKNIEFSRETYSAAYNKFSTFVSANQTAEDIVKNAKKDGYTVQERKDVTTTEHYLAGIHSTRDALKWVFEAKKGDVSQMYQCGDNDHLLVVVLDNIHKKGYRSLDDEQVKEMVKAEVLKDKKAEMLLAKLNGVKSVDAAKGKGAIVTEVNQITFAAPTFISATGASEPALSGAVAATAKGKFSAHPVKGNAGVYVFSVLDKTKRPGKFDEKLEQQKLRQRAMQYAGNFMNELYMKGNVVDNRYLFF